MSQPGMIMPPYRSLTRPPCACQFQGQIQLSSETPHPLRSANSPRLNGRVKVPGDKSISHRALMFGAVALGETVITGLLEGEDVVNTAKAMAALGVRLERWNDDDTWHVHGVGLGGFQPPAQTIDFGNSGTGARLAMGLLATSPITARMSGDASLRSRPMGRIVTPLEGFGTRFDTSDGGRMPLTLHGAQHPVPIEYRLPVASAQVKSAVLLAGLNAPGATTVIEPEPSNHCASEAFKLPVTGSSRRVPSTGKNARTSIAVADPAGDGPTTPMSRSLAVGRSRRTSSGQANRTAHHPGPLSTQAASTTAPGSTPSPPWAICPVASARGSRSAARCISMPT